MGDRFGDVRSILHGEPSQQGWQALCEALDAYQGAEPLEEVVLPYCLQALQGWPPEIERWVPPRWDEMLFEEQGPPELILCTHLELHDYHVGDRGNIGDGDVRALAASPHLAQLQHLDLSSNYIGDQGVEALAASAHLTRLQYLDLADNHIGSGGARALAASPNLASLRHLDLYGNRIGDEGARALASSPHLASLQHLNLHSNGIEDEGAAALAASPHLPEPIRAQWRDR